MTPSSNRLVKGATESTLSEQMQPSDYFSRHVKTCCYSFADYTRDDAAVDEKTRQLHKYMEDNLRNMSIMRDDYIVDRPQAVGLKRKHPKRKLLLLDLDETLIHCTGDHSRREQFE